MAHPLIKQLELLPHPEGGHYRQIYASSQQVDSPVHGRQRAAATQIYFLLQRGEFSRFHKVVHDEIWHFYAGAPLKLIEIENETVKETIIGGKDNNFVHVIPGDNWQAAESTGDYTLVGCTVAPGFDFEDFSFVTTPEVTYWIKENVPQLARFL